MSDNPMFRELEPLRRRFGDDAYSEAMLKFCEHVRASYPNAKPWPVSHWSMRMKQARSNARRSERARQVREARYAAACYPELADAPLRVVRDCGGLVDSKVYQ